MGDFTFNCPHCEQSLAAPEEVLGDIIECPTCKGSIQLPRTPPPSPHEVPKPGKHDADSQSAATPVSSERTRNEPAVRQKLEFAKSLGDKAPAVRSETVELSETSANTSPAIPLQRMQAAALGVVIPKNATYAQAAKILSDAARDVDDEENEPASKTQLSKVAKLGGDPAKATNSWRADEYIEELEEQELQFKERVDSAIEWFFAPDMRATMPVKKPTKAIMEQALKYGDGQRWGANWEDGDAQYDLMSVALYAVAPELLKKNERPPRLQRRGCLIPLVFALGACAGLLMLAFCFFA